MPGMMMPKFPALARLLLSLAVMTPLACAGAQTVIAPLPSIDKPPATRPPIAVPTKPDLTVPPLPGPPDPGDIPAAAVTPLPPPRVPGPPTGPEPAQLAGERSTLIYAAGAAVLPAGTDAVLADIVARLKAHPTERLDMRAFASAPADRATDGRRTALLRVRALRDRLVQLGIDPLRLLVFAESAPPAAPAGAPPPDRVDLVIRP